MSDSAEQSPKTQGVIDAEDNREYLKKPNSIQELQRQETPMLTDEINESIDEGFIEKAKPSSIKKGAQLNRQLLMRRENTESQVQMSHHINEREENSLEGTIPILKTGGTGESLHFEDLPQEPINEQASQERLATPVQNIPPATIKPVIQVPKKLIQYMDETLQKRLQHIKEKVELSKNAMTVQNTPLHSPKISQYELKTTSQDDYSTNKKGVNNKEFVRSLRKDAVQRQKRAESILKANAEKRLQDMELEVKIDQEKRAQQQVQKEIMIEERIEEIRRRKEERERKHQEWLRQMKAMKSSPPMFRQIEEQYEQRFVLPKIYEERSKLNEIKEQHMRVDLNEIRQHQLKVKEQLMMIEFKKHDRGVSHKKHKSMQQKNEQQPPRSHSVLHKNIIDEQQYPSIDNSRDNSEEVIVHRGSALRGIQETPMRNKRKIGHYIQSPFIEQVIEHDLKIKNEPKEKMEQLRQKRQKQDAYDKFIREMNPIKVSPRKNGEMLSNIQRLKHPVREKKEKYDNYLAEIKLQNMLNNRQQPSEGPIQKPRNQRLMNPLTDSPQDNSNSRSRSPKNKDHENPSARQIPKKRIDYLPETLEKVKSQLVSKKNLIGGSRLNNQSDWMDQLKKPELSQQDKIEIIKIKSEAMEQRAHQFERGMKVAGQNDKQLEADVNQLYLDSIRAKMALIEYL
ncbi:hypothetical protein FGO68_gene10496 [Halteria grandinella]|uniref:Uncharacterized protein n=1 Tax=Halteria grandinella TaxID=5974 RepID=A0A8J8SWW7_HALGN|nr:hypothetical protein FGO68_gene10496 [Halteria grandinella]